MKYLSLLLVVASLVCASQVQYLDNMPDDALMEVGEEGGPTPGNQAEHAKGGQQTPGGRGPAAGGPPANDVENCEVCVYILENKEQHQSYLCRSLQEQSQQKVCVQVLESLMWWVTNEVYWVNYGCQRNTETGGTEWVRPCPAHVVCGWIEDLNARKPFCNADPQYPKPR